MRFFSIAIFTNIIGNIYTCLFGIAIGIAIATITYLLIVLKKMNKNKKKAYISEDDKDKSKDEAFKLIHEYKEIFKDKKLNKDISYIERSKYLTVSLVENIAAIYYPKAKRPYLNITINDATKLIRYVSNRLDETLKIPGLVLVRGLSINNINEAKNLYKKIYDLKIVKLIYKFKLNKILFGFKVLINILNPIYWVRKLIVNRSFNVITQNICINILEIDGEEAYNIYSKNAYTEGVDLIENK